MNQKVIVWGAIALGVALLLVGTPLLISKVEANSAVVITPTPLAMQAITLANMGQTITMQVGDSITLDLGAKYQWSIKIGQPEMLSRSTSALIVQGTQGVFVARKPGTTYLTASGEPDCRKATPTCDTGNVLFEMTVVVK